MTLGQFEVLHAILESGSFNAASTKLHRAQSAVSYSIKKFEEELELQIFTREGYRPQLTVEGKAIYEKSKNLLLQAEELKQLGKHLSMGNEGQISLAVSALSPLSKLIEAINCFANKNPLCPVTLSVENLGGSMERLLDGDAHMILSEMIDFDEAVEVIPWTKIKFLPVAAPGYPPSRSKSPLQKSDMFPYVQIVVSDSSQHSKKKTAGVLKGAVHWTVNSFSIKQDLLVAGSGWGLMPQHMIQDNLDSRKLVVLNYQPAFVTETMLYLVRRTDIPSGPITQKFWEALKALGTEKQSKSEID